VFIGGYSIGANRFVNSVIDEVAIYTSILPDQRILTHAKILGVA
jgi:hypothetical protein